MRPIRQKVVVYVWFCETYKRVMRHFMKTDRNNDKLV